MVPADRATDPDGARGIPLTEPTTIRRAGAVEAPAVDTAAAE
jgi:hypothetical protein